MSDSESELSSTFPSNEEIEQGIRKTVKRLQRDDPDGELTVNRIRRAAEKDLSLEEGFLGNDDWKQRSKTVIQDQFEQEDEASEAEVKPKSKAKTQPKGKAETQTTSKAKAQPKEKATAKTKEAAKGGKGSSKAKQVVKKKNTKRQTDSEDELESEVEDPGPKLISKKRKSSFDSDRDDSKVDDVQPAKKAKTSTDKNGDESSALSDVDSEPSTKAVKKDASKVDDGSDSEMSVLIDDSPAPKQRKKSASGNTESAATETKSKTKSNKEAAEADPNQEEIKKLQGQLGQCGIRKVWGKYLKPYETQKAKIKHLKEMLVEAGMTGRFSQEKAKQIRDQRELAADLEDVTEGNKAWGKRRSRADDTKAEEKPKRQLAKGFADLAFISDGEES